METIELDMPTLPIRYGLRVLQVSYVLKRNVFIPT